MNGDWSPHLVETIHLGPWTVHAVADARFRADGGVAFSMVPRALWEKEIPVGPEHTIPLRVGVVLLDGPGGRVVIDTGLGERRVDRAIRGFFGELSSAGGLTRALRELDWAPDSVTHVILTHLHVDHAGGLFNAAGDLRFPAAKIFLSRRELRYALDPHPLRGPVYDARAAELLTQFDNLVLVDAMLLEIIPGLELIALGGHSPGLLGVRLTAGEETLFLPGDLIPTRAHRRPRWVLSYDQDPSTVYDQRKLMVARAMALGWIVHFDHDATVAFGRFAPGGAVQPVQGTGDFKAR